MSWFRIYRHDGTLRLPTDAQARRADTEIIEDLVGSAHADIYYDPGEPILVHRFEARSVYDPADRATEYYVVYLGQPNTDSIHFEEFWNRMKQVYESGDWRPVDDGSAAANEISYYESFRTLADMSVPEPVELDPEEQVILYYLQNIGSGLDIGMNSYESAVRAFRIFSDSGCSIVVGSNVVSDRFEDVDLTIEYGAYDDYEPVTKDTRENLREASTILEERRMDAALADFWENTEHSVQKLVLQNSAMQPEGKHRVLEELETWVKGSTQGGLTDEASPMEFKYESEILSDLKMNYSSIEGHLITANQEETFQDEVVSRLSHEREELRAKIKESAADTVADTLEKQVQKIASASPESPSRSSVRQEILAAVSEQRGSDDGDEGLVSELDMETVLIGFFLGMVFTGAVTVLASLI